MYADNELLFPPYVISRLRNAGGDRWTELVDQVRNLPENDLERLAFCLMMVRFLGCVDCETDSYRAMRGCTACALQGMRRHKEGDHRLLERYEKAALELNRYLSKHPDVLVSGDRVVAARAA
jgi:hypothetical protein